MWFLLYKRTNNIQTRMPIGARNLIGPMYSAEDILLTSLFYFFTGNFNYHIKFVIGTGQPILPHNIQCHRKSDGRVEDDTEEGFQQEDDREYGF